jgi:hypothetical protein
MKDLNIFVTDICDKIRKHCKSEEELEKHRQRLKKEYEFIFSSLQEEDEEEEYSFGREESIIEWRKHYEELEKQGIYVFSKEEQIQEENARGNFGRTELHEAVNNNDIEEVKRLLENGADVTLKDNSGFTPLIIARLNGYADIITLLSEKEK